jgi:hypothetical protein
VRSADEQSTISGRTSLGEVAADARGGGVRARSAVDRGRKTVSTLARLGVSGSQSVFTMLPRVAITQRVLHGNDTARLQ